MNAVSSGLTFIDWRLTSKDTSHHQGPLYTCTALSIICFLVGRAVIVATCYWRFYTEDLWRLLCHGLIRGWIMLREMYVRQVLTESSSRHISRTWGNARSKRAVLLRAIINHNVWSGCFVKVYCTLKLCGGVFSFLFLIMVHYLSLNFQLMNAIICRVMRHDWMIVWSWHTWMMIDVVLVLEIGWGHVAAVIPLRHPRGTGLLHLSFCVDWMKVESFFRRKPINI